MFAWHANMLDSYRVLGRPMKVDVFSVVQNGKRTISFMSQALGLMADLDIGTEHLRWMGDTRFMYGLLRGSMDLTLSFALSFPDSDIVITHKPCPVKLSYKLAESDKLKMAKTLEARQRDDLIGAPSVPSIPTESSDSSLPPLKNHSEDEEGWVTLEEPLLYVYAGKGPYVGRCVHNFECAME